MIFYKTAKFFALSFLMFALVFGSTVQIVFADSDNPDDFFPGDPVVETTVVESTDVGSENTGESITEDESGAVSLMSYSPVVPNIDLSCKITSPDQTGWYGTYYNYKSNTPGMELPDSQWRVSYGDPLSGIIPWAANWYDQSFARFSRIDSSLMFGDNFFPFNSNPEELTNGKEYHFGAHWSATVYAASSRDVGFTLKSDDDAWVYVNSALVSDNSGVHAVRTITATTTLQTGANRVDIYFAERHTVASYMDFSFNDSSLVIKPYSPACTTNTPPTIVLVGPAVSTTTLGVPFVESGTIATDLEDGDISSKVVVSGTVDYLTVGTYILTYTVTDSGGLSASITRTVNVVDLTPPPPPSNNITIAIRASKIVCNSESDLPNWGQGGPNVTSSTTNQFLSTHPNCHLESGWKFQWATENTPDPGKALVGEAAGWNTFGPTNSYGIATTTASISSTTKYVWVREVLKDGYLPFTYPSSNDPYSAEMYCHQDVLNYDNYDKAEGPLPAGAEYYCVAFNVLKVPPATNTPPTIALLGANPFELTVNTSFVDPGATATDLEDGNATTTASIVRTGTVNASTVGTYILTYSVTDSGGLSTSTERTVNVVPEVCTSNCGGEPNLPTVSLTANPSTITLGSTTTLSWSSSNATACLALWTLSASTSGSFDISPATTTTYSMTCSGSGGAATSTAIVTVNPVIPPVVPPTTNPPTTTTGGGGGGGGIGGRRHDITTILGTQGEILGATSCTYLRDFLKIGWQNDKVEVLKLQSFLNQFEGESLSLTGVFDEMTFIAVSKFQNKYFDDVLAPWGHDAPTGFVYITTKKKINEIYCNSVLSLSQAERDEISSFKSFLENNPGAVISGREVGSLPGSGTKSSVLSDVLRDSNISDSSSGSPVVELENNSDKDSVIRNAAISLFAVPKKIFNNTKYSLIFLALLLVVIGVAIKLFGSSKKNSTEIEELMAAAEKIAKDKTVGTKESPVIILPAADKNKKEEILPDEEIVIEDDEEEIEEIK